MARRQRSSLGEYNRFDKSIAASVTAIAKTFQPGAYTGAVNGKTRRRTETRRRTDAQARDTQVGHRALCARQARRQAGLAVRRIQWLVAGSNTNEAAQ